MHKGRRSGGGGEGGKGASRSFEFNLLPPNVCAENNPPSCWMRSFVVNGILICYECLSFQTDVWDVNDSFINKVKDTSSCESGKLLSLGYGKDKKDILLVLFAKFSYSFNY